MNYEFSYYRCQYKYWFNNEEFGFSWTKGGKSHSDKVGLEKLSSHIDVWTGKPQSTKSRIRRLGYLFPGAVTLVLITQNRVGLLAFPGFIFYALYILYDEAGFINEKEYAVILLNDNSEFCYILNTSEADKGRGDFFNELVKAIERKHNKPVRANTL